MSGEPRGAYRMTVTHLSESGGTFIDARLTWVRLKAELKNWRNVGKESLAFLRWRGKWKRTERRRSFGVYKGQETGAGQRAPSREGQTGAGVRR